ncbi:MAG TPA: gluconate:H+ symporter [Flavisolibacter sp.]|jgi:gluconate transporter|nr:gluconate:H+ symporter [Flavisolibacter sp.]
MPIIILIASLGLLLLLITVAKLNTFIALIAAALFVGICNGMDLQKLTASLTAGTGSTLGSVLLVLGFGVMLGSLLTETGATQKISEQLIHFFGPQRAKLAVLLTAFLVGIALFYNAGFVVLVPLVFSLAVQTGKPLVYLAIAMCSALSVTHGFLPPHPGPTAVAAIFKADVGKTLIYGLFVAVPALLVAGIIFPQWIKKMKATPPPGLFTMEVYEQKSLPPFSASLLTALLPVLLMGATTGSELLLPHGNYFYRLLKFMGDPGIAMLIAVLFALVVLGAARRKSIKTLMDRSAISLQAVTPIFLIIAAGGAFKQVLLDSGTGTAITAYFQQSALSPLLLGWVVATVIRIAIGSATVAALTAAAIVQPLLAADAVQPELMVLSIGAGSLMCSHVNDSGFWMFKEYFGLSLADTFRSWTVMETIVGIMGLLGVLVLQTLL